MTKIIGNTTTTPMARPDWNQNDNTKANYIENKPSILTEEDVVDLIAENSTSITNQVQADWAQTDETQVDYIKNKPSFKFDTLLSASIDTGIFNLKQENDACIVSIENNVLTLS